MAEHELKILPAYFKAVVEGAKTFEFRKDDRGFEVGDTLILKEWAYELIYKNEYGEERWGSPHYTGRSIEKEISYILRGGLPGCRVRKGLAILGLKQEGIKFINIDLTGVSEKEQFYKVKEEEIEFKEAIEDYMDNPTEENKLHVIEELFDEFQSKLGLLDMRGISANEVMCNYNKHLEKSKDRPRKEELRK